MNFRSLICALALLAMIAPQVQAEDLLSIEPTSFEPKVIEGGSSVAPIKITATTDAGTDGDFKYVLTIYDANGNEVSYDALNATEDRIQVDGADLFDISYSGALSALADHREGLTNNFRLNIAGGSVINPIVTGTIVITPRDNSRATGNYTVVVTIPDDTDLGGTEPLSKGSPDSTSFVFVDDEPPITITPAITASESTPGTVTFSRAVATAAAVDVQFEVADGSATLGVAAPDDFGVGSADPIVLNGSIYTITIPANETSATLDITAIDDDVIEGTETFYIVPKAPSPMPGPILVQIEDDEPAITSINLLGEDLNGNGILDPGEDVNGNGTLDSSVSPVEPNGGGGNTGTVAINLDSATEATDTLELLITGTATHGALEDYTLNTTSGNLSVPTDNGDGTYSATWEANAAISQIQITITPIDDNISGPDQEGNETVEFLLNGAIGYAVTIIDGSDPLSGHDVIEIQATSPKVREDSANRAAFTLTRNSSVGQVTVNYTLRGEAIPGVDYTLEEEDGTPLTGFATFPDGQSSIVVYVDPITDRDIEAPERVVMALTASDIYFLGTRHTDTAIIQEDDITIQVEADRTVARESSADYASFIINFYDSYSIAAGTPIALSLPEETAFTLIFGGSAVQQPDASGDVDYNIFVRHDQGPWVLVDDDLFGEVNRIYEVLGGVPSNATYLEVRIVAAEIDERWPSENHLTFGTWDDVLDYFRFDWLVDQNPEGAEDITLTVLESDHYIRSTPTDTVIIEDNDLFLTAEAVEMAGEPSHNGQFKVTLSTAVEQDIEVRYTVDQTIGYPATPGVDYVELSGVITIAAGATEAYIPVIPIADSDDDEGPETISIIINETYDYKTVTRQEASVTLSDLIGKIWIHRIDISTAVDSEGDPMAIFDADTPPNVIGVKESDETIALFRVHIFDRNAANRVEVRYQAGGRTDAPNDYATLPEIVSIENSTTVPPAFETENSAVIAVTLRDDGIYENAENLSIRLLGGAGYIIATPAEILAWYGTDSAVPPSADMYASDWTDIINGDTDQPDYTEVDIIDNEPQFELHIVGSTVPHEFSEGTGSVDMELVAVTGEGQAPIDVSFSLSGTASYGINSDYMLDVDTDGSTGTITVPGGSTAVPFSIQINQDNLVESDETIVITLDTPDDGGAYGINTSSPGRTITITDDEPTVNITALNNAFEGNVSGRFLIEASPAVTGQSTSFDIVFSGDLDDSEYTVTYLDEGGNTIPGASIPVGGTSVTIVIDAAADGTTEGAETLTATITPSSRFTSGTLSASITVQDEITVNLASEPDDVVVLAGSSTVTSLLVQGSGSLTAADFHGSLQALGGGSVPAWASISANATAVSAEGVATLGLTLTPPAGTASGYHWLRAVINVDVDQNGSIDLSGTDQQVTQDILYYVQGTGSGNS